MNPHDFQHFWTTMMEQDYGLNDEGIELPLGHKRESNGMAIVYHDSSTERLLANTERKIGDVDEPMENPLTPERCAVCDEDLEAHWRCRPVCRTANGP